MIDGCFRRTGLHSQRQVRDLLGEAPVSSGTVQAEDLPAGFLERPVLGRITLPAFGRRVSELVVHFHGEATGHTRDAIHDDHRDVYLVSVEDMLQVVADHHVPLELEHQQGLPEKVSDRPLGPGAEHVSSLDRLPGLGYGNVHLALLPGDPLALRIAPACNPVFCHDPVQSAAVESESQVSLDPLEDVGSTFLFDYIKLSEQVTDGFTAGGLDTLGNSRAHLAISESNGT